MESLRVVGGNVSWINENKWKRKYVANIKKSQTLLVENRNRIKY